MNTIVIWDEVGEAPIQFFVLEGDFSRLDGIYINAIKQKAALQKELLNLVYPISLNASHITKIPMLKNFPYEYARENAFCVIICGFMP